MHVGSPNLILLFASCVYFFSFICNYVIMYGCIYICFYLDIFIIYWVLFYMYSLEAIPET